MKTLFKCLECGKYTLNKDQCPKCDGQVKNPYPARFSIEKEKKFRRLYSK